MTKARFNHVGIACKDMAVIERFYCRHFGFRRARVVPVGDTQIIFLKSGDFYLELFQAKEESPVPSMKEDGQWYPGWRHIAFAVDSVDDKLAEMGGDACVTLGPFNFDAWLKGWRGVWIADPEGNIIELAQGYIDEKNPVPLE
ncbi:VOC family protein [Desulfobulbus sp. F5]|nr:VOC family protein [Desulfobulbus sp. F5]